MSKELLDVSYIIIGSKERLSKVKSYQIEEGVECLLCPFQSLQELPSLIDSKIADLDSSVISIIPAGAFPRKEAREQLVHFSRSEYQFWGWYHFGNKFKGAAQRIRKLNTKKKFVSDGVFNAEVNALLQRILSQEGYSGIEIRATSMTTEIRVRVANADTFVKDGARKIREIKSVIEK